MSPQFNSALAYSIQNDERGMMGLDVKAVNNLEYAEPLDWDVYEELYDLGEKITYLQVNPHFPHSSVGVVDGIYRLTPDSEEYSWHAGSYGGYNLFREFLAESAGYTPHDCWESPYSYLGSAFYELVNFSDAEGTIGTEASRALYQDFVENREAFVDFVGDDDVMYFVERYDVWTEGLRIASNNGYVIFH